MIRGVGALVLLVAGCGPVATFTARGPACPAQPAGCEVTVINQRPQRPYQIIGVLDIEAFSVRGIPNDENEFLALVAVEVCRRGGDAVIPGVTGDGRFVVATVVKWVEPGTTEPVCAPPPDGGVPEAAPDAGTATEAASDAGAETEAGTEATLDAGTGAETGTEAGAETETGAAPVPAPACPGGPSC